MTQFDFIKMHGLGNDFVIIDARTGGGDLDNATVRAIADRKTGIGCDQLIVMEPARMIEAAFFSAFEMPMAARSMHAVTRPVRGRPRHDRNRQTMIQFQTAQGS